jgi:hypothetical protein
MSAAATPMSAAAMPRLSRTGRYGHESRGQNACQQRSLFLDCHDTTSMVSSAILGVNAQFGMVAAERLFKKSRRTLFNSQKSKAAALFALPCWETIVCKKRRDRQPLRRSNGTTRFCSRVSSAKTSA